jgi:hypothetical protein
MALQGIDALIEQAPLPQQIIESNLEAVTRWARTFIDTDITSLVDDCLSKTLPERISISSDLQEISNSVKALCLAKNMDRNAVDEVRSPLKQTVQTHAGEKLLSLQGANRKLAEQCLTALIRTRTYLTCLLRVFESVDTPTSPSPTGGPKARALQSKDQPTADTSAGAATLGFKALTGNPQAANTLAQGGQPQRTFKKKVEDSPWWQFWKRRKKG